MEIRAAEISDIIKRQIQEYEREARNNSAEDFEDAETESEKEEDTE